MQVVVNTVTSQLQRLGFTPTQRISDQFIVHALKDDTASDGKD